MAMKRIVCLMMGMIVLGCGCQDKKPALVVLEILLAETEPAEGLTEIFFDMSGNTLYFHEKVVISNDDVASTSAVIRDGRPVVELTFTEIGREKFAEATEVGIGKHAGIFLDGKLVSAPFIKAPIHEGKALIVGDFTEDEARKIARGIISK